MKLETLKKRSEFDHLFKRGKIVHRKGLVIYIAENDMNKKRVGISIKKSVGNAVARNRIKRLLKEILRKIEIKGIDLLIIVKKEISKADYRELEDIIIKALSAPN